MQTLIIHNDLSWFNTLVNEKLSCGWSVVVGTLVITHADGGNKAYAVVLQLD